MGILIGQGSDPLPLLFMEFEKDSHIAETQQLWYITISAPCG